MKAESKRLSVDPVDFDLVKNAMSTLCDEMATSLARAAYSPLIRQALDCATAIVSPDNEVIAQGRTTPLHFTTMMEATRSLQSVYARADLREGDVFMLNDPYSGGTHLPDIFLIRPIFSEGNLLFFLTAEAHHVDVGGRVPGSVASDSKEIFEEGIRIPPVRLVSGGKMNDETLRLLLNNIRIPDQTLGDLHAQLSAIKKGTAAITDLVATFGAPYLKEICAELLDYSEFRTTTEIRSWPDGTYEFTDWIDSDGIHDAPLTIESKLVIDGGNVTVDFEGTSEQVETAINQPRIVTEAAVLIAIAAALPSTIPHNSGILRRISVKAPEGSVVNPRLPAAVAGRVLTAYRTLDTVIGCLSQVVPERMMAAGDGGNSLITLAGREASGAPWVWTDIHVSSWGARAESDGVDGLCNPAVAVGNTPVEQLEREVDVRIRRYEFVADTGGAGRYRGGLAVVRDYEPMSDTILHLRSDRAVVAPYGLEGGRPGTLTKNIVFSGDGSSRAIPAMCTIPLAAGEVFSSQMPGGGGWGDPLRRDPASVYEDIVDEKVSREQAVEVYGVMTGADGVDKEATEALRSSMRLGRNDTDDIG